MSQHGANDATEITIGMMTMKWKTMADELETNKEARCAQYVVCSQVGTHGSNCIHLATDKAPVTGQHLQNTIITIPSGVGFLCCPQATQMQMLSSPLNLYPSSRNRSDSRQDFSARGPDPVAVVIFHF